MSDRNTKDQFQYLDDEERALMESLERDEWHSVDDVTAIKTEAVQYAKATLKKDRRMNVRMTERDLRNLKVRAAEEGIPYQTLVTMVLHKYVTGKLTETR